MPSQKVACTMKNPEEQHPARNYHDEDTSSVASFEALPKPPKQNIKFAWMGGTKVGTVEFYEIQRRSYMKWTEKGRLKSLLMNRFCETLG